MPTVSVPVLLKLPARGKCRSASKRELAAVGAQCGDADDFCSGACEQQIGRIGGDVRAAGEVELGTIDRVQVPPVSVPAEICLICWSGARSDARLIVPESASIVPVLLIAPNTSKVDVPVPAVLRIVPSLSSETCPGACPVLEASLMPESVSSK